MGDGSGAVRFAHFSDVHLTSSRLGWTRRTLLGKQVTGWMNVKVLGRGHRFRFAPLVTDAMIAEIRADAPDGVIFSGDATTLAFESEFHASANRLSVGDPGPAGFAVAGNHDYYTHAAWYRGHFEKRFAAWQEGLRLDDQPYPFARKIGHAWLIGLNTSTANLWPWDASGRAGDAQLARLRKLAEQLDAGPRILVTHYPLRKADGQLERRGHRLRDHAATLEAARDAKIGLWLHGHIHQGFVLEPTRDIPFPIVNAGSCTQTNLWSYNRYTLTGHALDATRRTFDVATQKFADAGTFRLTLPT